MARCSNCKAPLPPGSQVCDYCGNRTDIDLQGIHHYTTHDLDSPRSCPRCNVKLKTVNLTSQGRFLIERCGTCHGLFFDPGELEALLEATVTNVFEIDRERLNAVSNDRRPDQHPIAYIKCPVCSELMHRVNFGAKSGVIVDRCRAHGIWLDGGELRQLFEWMKLGGHLLEQQRKEEQRKEAEKREQAEREKLKGWAEEPSAFDRYGGPLRQSDPDLFELIIKAIRFFMK
jgi:Zn-finger nucleic acid-binding protein